MRPWRIKLALFGFGSSCWLGCVTAESISASQVPPKSLRTNVVTAHSWSPKILWIPFGSGFIDDARSDLIAQCPTGSIEGLLTKHEVTNYLFTLYETTSVTMTGYCIHGSGGGKGGGGGGSPKGKHDKRHKGDNA